MVGRIDLPRDRLAAFGLDQADGFLAMGVRASGNDDDGDFASEAGASEAGALGSVLGGQAVTSMTTPLASKPWLARSSCCE